MDTPATVSKSSERRYPSAEKNIVALIVLCSRNLEVALLLDTSLIHFSIHAIEAYLSCGETVYI